MWGDEIKTNLYQTDVKKKNYGGREKQLMIQSMPHYRSNMVEAAFWNRYVWLPVIG